MDYKPSGVSLDLQELDDLCRRLNKIFTRRAIIVTSLLPILVAWWFPLVWKICWHFASAPERIEFINVEWEMAATGLVMGILVFLGLFFKFRQALKILRGPQKNGPILYWWEEGKLRILFAGGAYVQFGRRPQNGGFLAYAELPRFEAEKRSLKVSCRLETAGEFGPGFRAFSLTLPAEIDTAELILRLPRS